MAGRGGCFIPSPLFRSLLPSIPVFNIYLSLSLHLCPTTSTSNSTPVISNMAAPVPVPKIDTGVDEAHDLSPTSPVDRKRMERMMANRPNPDELQNKNILKGNPNDSLAAKRAELERSMRSDRLDKDIGNRPSAEELIRKGILSPDKVSPHE